MRRELVVAGLSEGCWDFCVGDWRMLGEWVVCFGPVAGRRAEGDFVRSWGLFLAVRIIFVFLRRELDELYV